jgi:mRNA-degrading endonuclease RelE of RelBE toxin-antitoxin system
VLPYRIEWLEAARGDVRVLDRATAMNIFDGVLHYARTGGGKVMPLHGDMAGSFRLRLGDYRVLFTLHDDVMRIFGVRHRSEAYR